MTPALATKIRDAWRRWQRKVWLPSQVQVTVPSAFHGSAYGGWSICPAALSETTRVYSFGVGEDITFDLSLIATYQLSVYAFDPTPKSIEWISAQQLPSQFHFSDYGIAGHDGTAVFYPPENPSYISHSMIASPSRRGPHVVVPVWRLSSIMERLAHTEVHVIKMDIEGAEYEVIRDLIASRIRPAQLLVEFHHRFENIGWQRTAEAIRALNRVGYRIFSISGSLEEYSFIGGQGGS